MRMIPILLAAGLLLAVGTRPAAADPFFLSQYDTIVDSPGGNPSGSHCVTQLQSDLNGTVPYGYITFVPQGSLMFNQINNLNAVFSFPVGNYGGGSPRFEIPVDTDGNGSADGSAFAYIGTPPSFTDPGHANFISTGNFMLDFATTHWDLTQFGGPFYGTLAQALALLGTGKVLDVEFVVDGGFTGNQVALVDSFTVNNQTYVTVCDDPEAVPEPTSLLVWAAAAAAGLASRRWGGTIRR